MFLLFFFKENIKTFVQRTLKKQWATNEVDL